MLSRVDMRPVLASVSAPTLVIRRADDAAASPSSGRYLAEHVVDGEYVEVPGADSLPWLGDQGRSWMRSHSRADRERRR